MNEIWKIIQNNIGFSWRGILVVALAMLPNILYGILSKNNMPKTQIEPNQFLAMIENGSRMLFIVFFIAVYNKNQVNNKPILLIGMAVFLLIYYYLWGRYFVNGRDVAYLGKNLWIIPIPMAIFPILYFVFAALWLNNIPAVIALAFFAIGHCVNSYCILR